MSNYVIIPAHNNLHLTRKAVKSVLAQDIPAEVWLIDNASSDGTSAWAQSQRFTSTFYQFDGVSLVHVWNAALSFLFNTLGEDYALVINNDVELRPDTYRLLLSDGGGFVTAVGVAPESRDKSLAATPSLSRSPHPDFSCFLIRKWVWEKVGPFDENFKVAFGEDWDYHCRLHKAGIDAYAIDLPYIHYGSATIKNAPQWEKQMIAEQAERNREYFKEKWGFYGGSKEYEAFFRRTA